MPLFHFHLRSPAGLDEDDVGIELPDLESAYLEAYRAIPDLTADVLQDGADPLTHVFVIADAAGAVLTEVPFVEGLGERRPSRPNRCARAHQLSQEIAAEIVRAREIAARSRAIVARIQMP